MVTEKRKPDKTIVVEGDLIGYFPECEHGENLPYKNIWDAKNHEKMCRNGWFCEQYEDGTMDKHSTHKTWKEVEICNQKYGKDQKWLVIVDHLINTITCPNGHTAGLMVEPEITDEYECCDQKPILDIEFICSDYYETGECPYRILQIEYKGWEELYLGRT